MDINEKLTVPEVLNDLTVIESLENGTIPKESLLSVDFIESKIIEFSNLLNSIYRLPLLESKKNYNKESLVFLLISLKKTLKAVLEELGKGLVNRSYSFRCSVCDEAINIEPAEDIWSSLQDHEHFEKLYIDFLNNKLKIVNLDNTISDSANSPESEINLVNEISVITGDSNTDSGIEQQEIDPDMASTSGINQLSLQTPEKDNSDSDENINSFRFNFQVSYDEVIEAKLYHGPLMLGVRRYDKVKEYTMQRTGNYRAVCLICNCELNGARINKQMLVGHAMGQKHLRAVSTPQLLEILRFYHEFWLKQEPIFQAHQSYFKPDIIPNFKCALCFAVLHRDKILQHIFSDVHKKKVLAMFEKGDTSFYLINLQVQVYGITPEQIEAREIERKEKNENKVKERRPRRSEGDSTSQRGASESDSRDQRVNSESDSPDENKNMATPTIDHNIIKSVENPTSSNLLDLLPNRMQQDAKFFKIKKKSDGVQVLHCDLCKTDVAVSLALVKTHIIMSTPHVALKKDKYKYYCEICNVRLMNETAWLSHNFNGPRHVNMAQSRKVNVTEYECTTCKTVLFGDELSLTRHRSFGRGRGTRREKGSRLPEAVKKLFSSKEHLQAEAAVLAGQAEEVLNNSLTKDCCEKIRSSLLEQFDYCEVYPFGSRISGIGNMASDLDVFVDTGNMYWGEENQDPPEQVQIIRKAVKGFARNKEYGNLVQVLTARTPILKLRHIPSKLDCDLSFKHGLSVENTKFLRFCIELQPISQQFILIIKQWAQQIGFENVSTYALAILCIFYLQLNGYLLSVEAIRKINVKAPKSITGWKTMSYVLPVEEMKKLVKVYPNTVFELLQEFFHYYLKFDFNTYVVCPLLGHVVQKKLFIEDDGRNLPIEMAAYLAQLQSEDPEPFRANSLMCIQDPFDLSHNLTKAVQQGTLTKFQNMCKLSLAQLDAIK